MDVRQLEFFVAVTEEGTFTAAAQRSFVSQPGLSASIKALERELRTKLFDRGSAGASLTESGRMLLPRARHMLDQARLAQREISHHGARPASVLRVGSEQCLGDLVDLVDLVTVFARRNDHVDLSLRQLPTEELVAAVAMKALDLALVAGSPADLERYADAGPVAVLRREGFRLVSAPDHRLAGSGDLPWAAVGDERTVDLAAGWAARRVLDQALAEAGIPRRSAVSVSDTHMVLDLVRNGFGVAAVPESIAGKPQAEGLSARPLTSPTIEYDIALLTSPDAGQHARMLAAMLIPHPEVVATQEHLTAALADV